MIEWARPYSLGAYLLVGIALFALLLFARWLAISPRLRRWSLFIPRLIVLAVLLLILLDPVRRQEFRLPDREAVAIGLIDCSRSMSLDEPQSRLDRVRQVIQELPDPAQAQQAGLSLFRFGERLSTVPDLTQLTPVEEASKLSDALEKLPGMFTRDAPKAIVVFSDGAATDAATLAETAAGYGKLKIPIYAFAVGDEQVRGDVAIQDLVVPRRVDAHTKVSIRGVVRSDGFDGERVVLQIAPAHSLDGSAPAPVATLPLTLASGEQPFEMVVEANPDWGELVLEAPALDGEATTKNNRAPFQLGAKGRKIRVLYMEGTMGAEYQWLQNALLEDPEIECTSMVVDQQYVERPRLMRVDDPYRGFPATREELLRYDVVICSDISLGAFTKEQLDWTVELVSERGGGFAMVGGITSFGAGGWDQTVWDQLIPVDMSGGTLGQGYVYHRFQVQVPREAEDHPIWRIVPDRAENRRILAAMPFFYGTCYIERLKPAATMIGVSASEIPGVGIMPVFAVESYGRGRTFAFSPDTTADWGREFESIWGEAGDNRYFRRFWRNVIRWLAENSINGEHRLHIETDRQIYRPGQPIELSVIAFDEKFAETTAYDLTARLRLPSKEENPTKPSEGSTSLSPAANGKGYSGEIAAVWRHDAASASNDDLHGLAVREVEVIATQSGKEVARARATINLLADSPELRFPKATPDTLAKLATNTGGKVLRDSADLQALLASLPETRGESIITQTPLWDRAPLFLFLLALLSVEWILRRWS
jgi:uncharacterized membrane protein